METRLQLTEKGVSISVKENDVIAAINMSKENIKLNAARIDLIGKVNAEWIKAGLLSGCQIRTSNTNNYVSLDDQFVRLYESGVARAFLGYYRRQDGAVQPTFILGSDEKLVLQKALCLCLKQVQDGQGLMRALVLVMG